MRKYFLTLSLFLMASVAMAVPAKRGVWKNLKLTDGTEVRAQLSGDEYVHYYESEDGAKYVEVGEDVFAPMTEARMTKQISQRRSLKKQHSSRMRLVQPQKSAISGQSHYLGKKMGLVILVEFTDSKFREENNLEKYKKVLNEENYREGSFRGSVADYFKAQSNGQFELDFDVVGPYPLKENVDYYGHDVGGEGYDAHVEDMIIEACMSADNDVNFADYDWDGDGEVEQVFVVYAGRGQADGGRANTIWPQMWYLSEYDTDKSIVLDGVTINTYACSCELSGSKLAGIGTFCHEFSHCLGLPDFYDTSYSGWGGMEDFDLMCSGCYNGNGFLPVGYTAHEKMMCGWQEPTVLAANDTLIENLKCMSDNGETFIIYNDAHPDEYYTIENRQLKGFDASYPSAGLLICHVDYDEEIWAANIPNTKVTTMTQEYIDGNLPLNDHQRMTFFAVKSLGQWYTKYNLFPSNGLDSLTATSSPAASLFNRNSNGKKYMDGAILDIVQNGDGTMNFRYRAGKSNEQNPEVQPGQLLFYETFDKCNGKGGNDGLWSGSIASSAFVSDNEGWEATGGKLYGANACAKFGTGSVMGLATTPAFLVPGEAILTFKAGAWNSKDEETVLTLDTDNSNITVEPNELTIEKGQWTDCTATLRGEGSVRLEFGLYRRFFLDDVKVVSGIPTAIKNHTAGTAFSGRIYTIDGRYVGTDWNTLRPGLYLMNGKKFVK